MAYYTDLSQNFSVFMTRKEKNKSFDDWTAQEVRLVFGISEVSYLPFMEAWSSAVHTFTATELAFLEDKRQLLARYYRSWNEDELKFQFISQLVGLTKLNSPHYTTFSQRKLTATINGIVLSGRPELMVATGQDEPCNPYFFIHEYKPSTKGNNDPLGQLLAAMLAAQAHNNDNLPLLGCFVIGAIWQFVVLEGAAYNLSSDYLATHTDDLQQIYAMLKQSKIYIEQRAI